MFRLYSGLETSVKQVVNYQFGVKFLTLTFHWKMLSSMVSASMPVTSEDSMMDTRSFVKMPEAAADVKT